MTEYLNSLAEPKEISIEVFIAGILQFTKIANFNKEERGLFFGNIWGGFHYANDLVTWWNEENRELTTPATAISVHGLSPHQWEYPLKETYFLVYKDKKPAEALIIKKSQA